MRAVQRTAIADAACRGARALCRVAQNGRTPLHLAVKSYNHGTAVVAALLDAGAAVNAENEARRANCRCRANTPLRLRPAGRRHVLTLRRAQEGATPLCEAAEAEEWDVPLEVPLLLIQRGAAVEAAADQELLARAAQRVHADLGLHLLWRGADARSVPPEHVAAGARDVRPPGPGLQPLLAAWLRGERRVWSRAEHVLFPSAFRADVAATLLATLGSLAEEVLEAHGERSAAPGRRALLNPLALLRNHALLEPLFAALLRAHMGGPPAALPPADG